MLPIFPGRECVAKASAKGLRVAKASAKASQPRVRSQGLGGQGIAQESAQAIGYVAPELAPRNGRRRNAKPV